MLTIETCFLFCFAEIVTKDGHSTGNYTGNYTAPRSGKYLIHGEIHKKGENVANTINSIRLLGQPSDEVIGKIRLDQNETQFVKTVELVENTTFRVQTNKNKEIQIDMNKSYLKVYTIISDSCVN